MDASLSLTSILTLLLAACAALCSALALWKVRRAHLKLFALDRAIEERLDNLFVQLTELTGLERDLALPQSLPSTRGWAGSPDFLRHLYRLAMRTKPLSIVECSSGSSTVVLARAVQQAGLGHVFSLEHDPHYAASTRGELVRQGLEPCATVIDAPLVEQRVTGSAYRWYSVAGLPSAIDLLVIDGPPAGTQPLARFPALPLLRERLAPGATVVLDDAARAEEKRIVALWCKEFGLERVEGFSAEKGIAVLRYPAGISGPDADQSL